MAFDQTTAAPGDIRTLAVKLRIAEGWHTYAIDKPTGVNVATELRLTLPSGWQAVGDWDIPEPHPNDDLSTYSYEKEVTFRRAIRIADTASGTQSVTCDVKYQSCAETMCLRPTTANLTTDLEIVSP